MNHREEYEVNEIPGQISYEQAVESLKASVLGETMQIEFGSWAADAEISMITDVVLASIKELPEHERSFAGHEVELVFHEVLGPEAMRIRFGSEIFLGAERSVRGLALNLAGVRLVIERVPSVGEAA